MPASERGAGRGPQLVRAVGFWGLVAFCINAVVGSGVFLLPSETYALLGPFSLWAPVVFALPVFVLVLCFAAAASHFNAPGGAYLYAGAAFGDFVGFETGWMNWLARITSLAALSNGFVLSLARLWPAAAEPGLRAGLIVGSLATLALIHALGVRYGAGTIYVFTVGKLFPLLLFVVVALALFPSNPLPASLALPGRETNWSEAALFMLFAYAGFENLGVPAGEYKDPRRHLPLALLVGVLGIAALYALAQLAAMAALPDLSGTATPIADAAAALMGPFGAVLVTAGAVVSILGTNAGTVLEGSRMLYALAVGRRPYRLIARVHPRFHTPVVAIAIHTGVAIPLALAGSFAQLALLSAVARMTTYLVTCAAVPRLSRLSPGFRIPRWLPWLGTALSLALFLTLDSRHLLAALVALAVGAALYGLDRLLPEREETLAEAAVHHDPTVAPATPPGAE
ncbi:MAG TPA: APC family permease [Thermoanaerobaculia bacterium]|nr:APC family permease [Thermoanaerobaculia bacterium]